MNWSQVLRTMDPGRRKKPGPTLKRQASTLQRQASGRKKRIGGVKRVYEDAVRLEEKREAERLEFFRCSGM